MHGGDAVDGEDVVCGVDVVDGGDVDIDVGVDVGVDVYEMEVQVWIYGCMYMSVCVCLLMCREYSSQASRRGPVQSRRARGKYVVGPPSISNQNATLEEIVKRMHTAGRCAATKLSDGGRHRVALPCAERRCAMWSEAERR